MVEKWKGAGRAKEEGSEEIHVNAVREKREKYWRSKGKSGKERDFRVKSEVEHCLTGHLIKKWLAI